MESKNYVIFGKILSNKVVSFLFLIDTVITFMGIIVGNFKEVSDANVGSGFFLIFFLAQAIFLVIPQLMGVIFGLEISKNEKYEGLVAATNKLLKFQFIDSFFCILTSYLFYKDFSHYTPFLSLLSLIISIMLCIITCKKKQSKII